VLTKNFTVFIKFWRFNAFFDEAFTVTSRSKTIAALRLCVLDGNASGVAFVYKAGKLPILTNVKCYSCSYNLQRLWRDAIIG
jgi:hypothetical protein